MSLEVQDVEKKEKKEPVVDFSFQFNITRERVEKKIYNVLCAISDSFFELGERKGALIVVGFFDRNIDYISPGMRQLRNNPIQKYIDVISAQFEEDVQKIFESGADGAIIINHSGQILGTGAYLIVEKPTLEIPDGTGTRHITAASFSTRNDVMAVFTLSEESLTVRMWKNGAFVEQYKPEEKIEVE